LLETLRALPPEKQAEVLDFAHFVQHRTQIDSAPKPLEGKPKASQANALTEPRALANADPNSLPDEKKPDIARNMDNSGESLVDSIRARIEPLGGVELRLPPREAMREPMDLGS
jgi:hypothetical protein